VSARITVGLPVYNGAATLDEALTAIRGQTYPDLEIVISDNGSTDMTAAICEAHAAADERIRYLRHDTNRGAAWNFNHVLHEATGEYFMWAAHDDVLTREFASKTQDVLARRPDVVLCHSEAQPVLARGEPWGERYIGFTNEALSRRERWNAVLRRPELHSAIYGLMRRAAAHHTRGLLACVSADWVFMIEMSLQGSIAQVPETLQYKRVPGASSDYHTREELLQYLGARSTRGGALLRPSRAYVTFQAIRALGATGLPWRERVVLAADACRVYTTGGGWHADAAEFAWLVRERRSVARRRSTAQEHTP
jgi:hypothetical protein